MPVGDVLLIDLDGLITQHMVEQVRSDDTIYRQRAQEREEAQRARDERSAEMRRRGKLGGRPRRKKWVEAGFPATDAGRLAWRAAERLRKQREAQIDADA
jgi:hypothetical protein